MLPIELVVLPALQGYVAKNICWCRLAGGRVQVESCHQGNIDDASSEIGLGLGEFLVGQRAQGVVLVAATDGDADNRHACPASLVDQPIGVASAKQLAKKHKNITLPENIFVLFGELFGRGYANELI